MKNEHLTQLVLLFFEIFCYIMMCYKFKYRQSHFCAADEE